MGSKIEVHVVTCERDPAYIHQTLVQVLASDAPDRCHGPISLYADTANTDFLGAYRHLDRLRVYYLDCDESHDQDRRRRHSRLCFNYYRALEPRDPTTDGILVLEDDVLVHPCILSRLSWAVAECQADVGTRFVMNLGGKEDFFADPSRRRGQHYVSYPGPAFYGMMGMYYTAAVTPTLREHLCFDGFGHKSGETRKPVDLLLAELFEDIPIYNTRYDLVCHVGDVSHVSPGCGIRPASRTFAVGLKTWK